jgi:hypothetical protein
MRKVFCNAAKAYYTPQIGSKYDAKADKTWQYRPAIERKTYANSEVFLHNCTYFDIRDEDIIRLWQYAIDFENQFITS